jgi:hypothetical protein
VCSLHECLSCALFFVLFCLHGVNMPLFVKTVQTKYRIIKAAGGGNLYRASRLFHSEQRHQFYSSSTDTYLLRNVNACQVGAWRNYTHHYAPAFKQWHWRSRPSNYSWLHLVFNRAVLTLEPKFWCCRRESLMDRHEKCYWKRNIRHVNRHHKYSLQKLHNTRFAHNFRSHVKIKLILTKFSMLFTEHRMKNL